MASSLADSYTKVVGSPINAGGSYRPGGDNIAISFTSGKKSTQEQLDELAIQKAKDDLARLGLLPVSSEQQRYQWESVNQKLAEEAAARAATQAGIDTLRGVTALQESRALLPLTIASGASALKSSQAGLEAQRLATQQATAMGPLDIQAKKQDISKAQIQTPIQTAAMQAGLDATRQAMETARLDELYREAAYKDTHLGLTPSQVGSTLQFTAARNAYSGGPVGSAADTAYMKAMGYNVAKDISYNQHGEPYVKQRALF